MSTKRFVLAACLLISLALWGCKPETTTGDGDGDTTHEEHADHDAHAGHSHEHGEGHVLWMERENLALGDCLIDLGFHGVDVHAGEPVAVAARIQRDGAPIEDAEIYASLLDAEGNVVAEEVTLAFHAGHDGEAAHYDTEGELLVPEDVEEITINYRVVLPDGTTSQYPVPVTAHHHGHDHADH